MLLNSQFKSWNYGISNQGSNGAGNFVADRWVCKFTRSDSICAVSRLDEFDGGANLAFSCTAAEHFYIRQYVPGLQQFSGRECTVVADVETSESGLFYDWYILGKYNSSATDRITIVDSTSAAIASGRNLVTLTFAFPAINPVLYTKNINNSIELAFRIITSGAKIGSVKIHSISFSFGKSANPPYYDPDFQAAQLAQFYESSTFTTGAGGLDASIGQKRVFFPFTAKKRLGTNYDLSYADAVGNTGKVSTYDLAGVRTDNVTPTTPSKSENGFLIIINSSAVSGIGCSWAVDSDFLV